MKNQPLVPLLLIALAAAFTGCSVRVDLADENTTTAEAPPSTITEKNRTAFSLGFLVDQESQPEPVPPVAMSKRSRAIEPVHEPASPPPNSRPAVPWGRRC